MTNSLGVITAAHQEGVSYDDHAKKKLEDFTQGIADKEGVLTEAKEQLKQKQSALDTVKAEIEAHDEKIRQAKAAQVETEKLVGQSKLIYAQAKIDEEKKSETHHNAEMSTTAAEDVLAATQAEKAEAETTIQNVLQPALDEASTQVHHAAQALETATTQLASAKKEVQDAESPSVLEQNTREIVDTKKDFMITMPTSHISMVSGRFESK